jgi:hypothetical protein
MRTFFKKLLQILDGTPAPASSERQRGQSFIELIFITPILMIMVVGIVEIGWYANNYINLIEAAKVGARRGPFLVGDNAPQLYEDKWKVNVVDNNGAVIGDYTSVVHPFIGYANIPAFPRENPTAADLENPRFKTRGYKTPLSESACGPNIAQTDYGFFNVIACTVLESLDPLEIRLGEQDFKEEEGPDGRFEWYQDDIVISVFSLQKVNNGPKGDINPDGYDSPTDADDIPEGTPYEFNLNLSSSVQYPLGHQVVVVGRWPAQANECYDGTTTLEEINRDPFDYITNNDVDQAAVTIDGEQVLLPFELSRPVYDVAGVVYDFDPYADTTEERQRGWVYTGQRRIETPANFTGDCWGSDFTLKEVQDLMNLNRFVLTDGNYQNRRRYLSSQGLVLVEIFWEHELLMEDSFPFIYGAYNLFLNLGGEGEAYYQDRNVIHVWSAFPAPAAEPNIVYVHP